MWMGKGAGEDVESLCRLYGPVELHEIGYKEVVWNILRMYYVVGIEDGVELCTKVAKERKAAGET